MFWVSCIRNLAYPHNTAILSPLLWIFFIALEFTFRSMIHSGHKFLETAKYKIQDLDQDHVCLLVF